MQKNPLRLVGVDYGTRRVGLALADPLRLFTQPLGTYPPAEALTVLKTLHAREGVEAVVIGWPLMLDGTEGAATEAVQAYINRLRKILPEVELIKWDERFTSKMAATALRNSGLKRKARREKARVDAAAAALLLQE